jgi:hypothetical protein
MLSIKPREDCRMAERDGELNACIPRNFEFQPQKSLSPILSYWLHQFLVRRFIFILILPFLSTLGRVGLAVSFDFFHIFQGKTDLPPYSTADPEIRSPSEPSHPLHFASPLPSLQLHYARLSLPTPSPYFSSTARRTFELGPVQMGLLSNRTHLHSLLFVPVPQRFPFFLEIIFISWRKKIERVKPSRLGEDLWFLMIKSVGRSLFFSFCLDSRNAILLFSIILNRGRLSSRPLWA